MNEGRAICPFLFLIIHPVINFMSLPKNLIKGIKEISDRVELRFSMSEKSDLAEAFDDIGMPDMNRYLVTVITTMEIKKGKSKPENLEEGIYRLVDVFKYKSVEKNDEVAFLKTRATLDKVIRIFAKVAAPKNPMTKKQYIGFQDLYSKTVDGIAFNEKIPEWLKKELFGEFKLSDYIPKEKLPKEFIEEEEIKYDKFHYWNHSQEKLVMLYDLLKEYKLIECQKNFFLSVFANQYSNKRIKWRGSILTHLFYLLFNIYGKKHDYEGLNIYEIIFDLFDYNKKDKGKETLRSRYNDFKASVQDTTNPIGYKRFRNKFKDMNKILHTVFGTDFHII